MNVVRPYVGQTLVFGLNFFACASNMGFKQDSVAESLEYSFKKLTKVRTKLVLLSVSNNGTK